MSAIYSVASKTNSDGISPNEEEVIRLQRAMKSEKTSWRKGNLKEAFESG